jgi:hypothetical protein
MITHPLSKNDFQKLMQGIVGRDLTGCYYITDRLVVFKAGKEYALRIWGDWEYEQNGKVMESTEVKPGEDGPAFRNRMGIFIESLKPKKIISITVDSKENKAKITLDTGGKFHVTQEKKMWISYSEKTDKTRHGRPDEKTGELTYSESE